jgi:hypothetical protein
MPNNIINASSSGSGGLITTAADSGSLELQSDGTTIATLSSTGLTMATGKLLAPTGPAFNAYLNSAQTVTGGTFTKATLDVEEFDTNSNFASSRFTPTIAGYYQINTLLRFITTVSLSNVTNSIYKNGAEYKRVQLNGVTFTADINLSNSCVVYLNGSTDYIELYGFTSGSGTLSFGGGTSATSMSGALVRSA